MAAQDYAATNRLLFKVLGVCSRVAVPINTATYLHSKNFKAVAYHPFAVRLRMNMALDRALHIVFGLVPGRAAFAVDVLHAVVFFAVAPIPGRAQHLVVILNPFLRDGRTKRLAHDKPIVVADNHICNREGFSPFCNVVDGFVQLIRTAQRIRVGFMVAAVMVVEDVADKNDVVAVEVFVLIYAELEITVKLERAVQITYDQDAPFVCPDEVQGFYLLRG